MGYSIKKNVAGRIKQVEKRQRMAEERERQLSYLYSLQKDKDTDKDATEQEPAEEDEEEIDEPFENLQDDNFSSCSVVAQEDTSQMTSEESEEHANLLVRSLFGTDNPIQGADDDADNSTDSSVCQEEEEEEEGADEVFGDSDDATPVYAENVNNNTLDGVQSATSHFTGFKHRITIEEEGS
eukprot:scaffold2562_cov78-Cylindrotheca_fusiformis.AAC.4